MRKSTHHVGYSATNRPSGVNHGTFLHLAHEEVWR